VQPRLDRAYVLPTRHPPDTDPVDPSEVRTPHPNAEIPAECTAPHLRGRGRSPVQIHAGCTRTPISIARHKLAVIMQARLLDSESLTRALKNRQVAQATVDGARQLTVQFSDGTVLIVEAGLEGIRALVDSESASAPQETSRRPTKRQLEYLSFISTYIDRYGRSPAESDIERHFLVSAPSVNQMMQLLARRGFITRQPGVPRSTRLGINLSGLSKPGIG